MLVIGGFVVVTIFVLAIGSSASAQDKQIENLPKPPDTDLVPPLSLDRLFHPERKYDYVAALPSAKWIRMADGGSVLLVKRDQVWKKHDPRTGEETDWEVLGRLRRQLAEADGLTDKQITAGINRLVSSMDSVDKAVLVQVGKLLVHVPPEMPAKILTRDASTWNDATLDPTQRKVAYTSEGDLFIVDVLSGRSHRLTDDASPTMLDGRLDWTYQEEIYGRGNYKGFRFSPDGNWMAMLRIDTSAITPYTLGDSQADRGAGLVRRYSKAGDAIPHAELYIWDLRQIDQGLWPPPRLLAKSTPEDPQIVTGMWWHNQSAKFLYSISDRKQTWRELRYVDDQFLVGATSNQRRWLREDSPAWVEPPSQPGFLRDGGIIWKSNLPTGRSRLYRLRDGGKTVTPLTPENFDVRDFVVDADGSFVLLTGGDDGDTTEQHVYQLTLETSNESVNDVAVDAAGLVKLTDGQGSWNTMTPDSEAAQLLIRSSSADAPTQLSVRTTPAVTEPSQSFTRVITKSESKLPGGWIPQQAFRIRAEDGFEMPALLKRSPSATPGRPGPVLIKVYGGPGIPIVRDRWSGTGGFYDELLARSGISVLTVDNRSSGGRGIADTWAVRGQLGKVEFSDVESAVAWLKKQSWVDQNRLAIRGWSFGGFLTLYSMMHSDVFVAGIAGGSVTDWREYDSFYTERYMGLPDENPEGYAGQRLVDQADKLSGRVLMIHGELDDNVHPSNTLRMAEALQKAGKPFDLMIYPGAAHSVRGPWQAWHMAQMTDEFLRRHLLGQ